MPMLATILMCGVIIGKPAITCDLEVTIRPHANRVALGDPFFTEITITNHGRDVVEATPRDLMGERFTFMLYDPDSQLRMITYGHGQLPPKRIEAGKSFKFYHCVFLPDLRATQHVFWSQVRESQGLKIWGDYLLQPNVHVTSNWVDLNLLPRDEEEMQLLQTWGKLNIEGGRKGPTPADFGIGFQSALNREQTAEVGAQVSGELGSQLRFCVRFQGLYALPKTDRKGKDLELVEWLRKQPDVKRQALTWNAIILAEGYNMPSTAKALQALIDEEQKAVEK